MAAGAIVRAMRIALFTILSLALAAASPLAAAPASPPAETARTVTRQGATRILDENAAQRLLNNKGLTLQWIDWDRRGTAIVSRKRGLWTLRGAQTDANGTGKLFLDGKITEIGADYFIFKGKIRITDTPDKGRVCEKDKVWRFAITQNRSYFRLREFEWCDGLTDYVDVYF